MKRPMDGGGASGARRGEMAAQAQGYPSPRAVTVIVPFAPGGPGPTSTGTPSSADIYARPSLASNSWSRNVGGAGGTTGSLRAGAAAHARWVHNYFPATWAPHAPAAPALYPNLGL